MSEQVLRNGNVMERSRTRTITQIAMLGALAGVLMNIEFPIPFLAPSFYQLDFSEIPVLVGTFAMGPVAGILIEVVKVLVHLVTMGTVTAGVGDFANFLFGCTFVVPAGIIYRLHHNKSRKHAVIGMAAGKLAPELQKKAVIWGTVGAIGMRLVFATLLVEALTLIPLIHLGGGLVLVWIAIQLLKGGDEDAHIEAKNSLMGAIWTIIVADAMMSIDNVIGVVGAAKGHLELVIVGMLITVPIIVFCSTLFARIINKFPVILWAGGALLGWVAGEMIVEDPLLMPYIQGEELLVKFGTVFFVLIVTGMIKIWKKRDA